MQLAFWWCVRLLRLAGIPLGDARLIAAREYAGTPAAVPPRPLPELRADKQPEADRRLKVEVHDTPEGTIVRLRGEAGVVEAGALEAALLRLAARRPAKVTIDLSELEFISSLAMGVLLAFRRGVVRTGGRVCLAPELRPMVREALNRAELLSLFEVGRGAEPDAAPVPCVTGVRKRYLSVSDVQGTFGVTWGELVEAEPQVESLLWRAREGGARCRTFADVERGFGPLRNELAGLFGFAGKHRRHPVLGSVGAYQVAYWKLYDAMAALVPAGADEARQVKAS
jgi:anti-anti-sigma factor